MNCPEFTHLKELKDKANPFCKVYQYPNGETFYIEPIFYTQLMGFKEQHPESFDKILKRIEDIVLKNKYVIFTGDFECIKTKVNDSYIYQEITDITDPLNIYVEDKSRGSDYGD